MGSTLGQRVDRYAVMSTRKEPPSDFIMLSQLSIHLLSSSYLLLSL
ncbi:hypothetical protein PVAG01_05092 [Phlyctema vagabunda]|uniref:Ycf15 n=1 Tax=Phlyctema vagabunda TaxID=108571 RepID=A0ABR4PJ29_9HELO